MSDKFTPEFIQRTMYAGMSRAHRASLDKDPNYKAPTYDGWPVEPGTYTKVFDDINLARAQIRFQDFLDDMRKTANVRPGFEVIAVNTVERFKGYAIVVTYKL